MPIYEYRCERCQKRFERMVSFRQANTPVLCPHCGASETRKQFSTFATVERAAPSTSSTCAPSGG